MRGYDERVLMMHYLQRVHDGADTDRQRLFGHFAQVIIEETSVCLDGVLSQCFQPSSRHQRRTGLVESNVTVRSNTCSNASAPFPSSFHFKKHGVVVRL